MSECDLTYRHAPHGAPGDWWCTGAPKRPAPKTQPHAVRLNDLVTAILDAREHTYHRAADTKDKAERAGRYAAADALLDLVEALTQERGGADAVPGDCPSPGEVDAAGTADTPPAPSPVCLVKSWGGEESCVLPRGHKGRHNSGGDAPLSWPGYGEPSFQRVSSLPQDAEAHLKQDAQQARVDATNSRSWVTFENMRNGAVVTMDAFAFDQMLRGYATAVAHTRGKTAPEAVDYADAHLVWRETGRTEAK